MKSLLRLVRIASLTLAAFCALPGIGALAQTTTTYTYAANYGFTSNGYYSYDGIPLADRSGNAATIWIYEGNNSYTGKPYSWLLFTGGPLEGLNLSGTGWVYSPGVVPNPGNPGTAYPPACNGHCTMLIGSFSGTDPNTGRTVTASVALNVYVFRVRFAEYEVYGGTVTVTE